MRISIDQLKMACRRARSNKYCQECGLFGPLQYSFSNKGVVRACRPCSWYLKDNENGILVTAPVASVVRIPDFEIGMQNTSLLFELELAIRKFGLR